MSHKDPFEVTRLCAYLNDIYPGLVVHRGKVHDYLGMTLDLSKKGKLEISMIPYLIGVLRNFPEELGAATASPASEHLFQVRPDNERDVLPEEQAQAFHHTVAQLLFMSTRARRDIQTAVSFLTSRVKSPDQDDWFKLRRCLKYLKGTIGLKLTLSVDDMSVIKWWADASYAVHDDCKGHTGYMMSLGEGAVTSASRKHKLNVKSSTESEIVGADDTLPQALWTRYFIEAQGYAIDKMILYQDNKSAILLETNGKFSSSKRTKHIKTRFFFIKDKIASGELEVQHCPTGIMWADILTKPLQGKAFYEMRAKLMGCPVYWEDDFAWDTEIAQIDKDKTVPSWGVLSYKNMVKTTSPQECVEDSTN